ncbi:MAG: ADP-forming succinate--CoA ligase subunit beta [candidate division WOR-3 bacterium]
MKLLEYEGRKLFEKYGIPVKKGDVAETPEKAGEIFEKIGKEVVIKAQVPVGGRGKAGGIKIANTKQEVIEKARQILNLKIKGLSVKKVLVAEAAQIDKELYISLTLDRESGKILIMAIKEGGVEVEEIAKERPESIYKDYYDPLRGIAPYQARNLAMWLFSEKDLQKQIIDILYKMAKLFKECHASLVEINPLAVSGKELVAVDSKIIIDDNAYEEYINKIGEKDLTYENEKELEAKSAGLSYVKLDGNIGCCVNGAGLAMATMDLIKKYGGEPANFLDIGGSSSPEKVKKAMEIILSDKNVKVIFFNIFGGITRCDDVAKGLIEALKEIKCELPIVVRITGTNEEKGKEILKQIPNLISVSSMTEGAKKAVELAK